MPFHALNPATRSVLCTGDYTMKEESLINDGGDARPIQRCFLCPVHLRTQDLTYIDVREAHLEGWSDKSWSFRTGLFSGLALDQA